MNDSTSRDPRLHAIPDTHGHAKGEHKPYVEERPLPLTARMLFLWFYHACRRGYPRFLMVADHMNYLTFEDPAAVNLVRRALKLAQAGDLYGAAETANVDVAHAAVVSEGLRRGMRYSIGAEVDNDPRSRPDAQNIVDAMRPDAMIRSVHFVQITHPVHGEGWHWPFDNPEFADLHETVGVDTLWDSYVATLVDAIERLPGHIVGHFYVPAVFGHWPDDAKLEQYEDRVLEAAAARGMAIEFNTRFLYRDHTDEEKQRYLAANKRLLRKAKDRGVGIAIGSDAHSPKDQGGAFATVLAVLDELDINEIVFPLGGLLRRVALRVVREPEPEPPPEPVRAARPPEPPAPPKPVRKARPSPTPEREPERTEAAAPPAPAEPGGNGSAAADADAPSETAVPPPKARPAKRAPKTASSSNGAPQPPEAAAQAAVPTPEPPAPVAAKTPVAAKAPVAVKVVAKAKPAAAKTAARSAPASKAAVKAKPPAAKAKPPVRGSAKPAAKAKPPARKAKPPATAGRSSAKKAVPARSVAKKAAPKKSVPARKAGSKKAAPKKATPARVPAKKAGPAKKTVAKKSAPARHAPARKPTAAKKTAKKTATKRR